MRIVPILALQLALATHAFAQNSTNAPPQDAAKEGGAEGDQRGAIRSLGGVGNGSKTPVRDGVKIPDYGGHTRHPADALPPGTSRPGSGQTYAVPR